MELSMKNNIDSIKIFLSIPFYHFGLVLGRLWERYVVREAFCVSAIALTGWLTATCCWLLLVLIWRGQVVCVSRHLKKDLEASECTKIIKKNSPSIFFFIIQHQAMHGSMSLSVCLWLPITCQLTVQTIQYERDKQMLVDFMQSECTHEGRLCAVHFFFIYFY